MEAYPIRWFQAELDDMKRKAEARGMKQSEYIRFLVARDRPVKKK